MRMRRFLTTAAAVAAMAAVTSGPLPSVAEASVARKVDCTDYCGEKAAENCDRIDGWNCAWYMLGCLAGCNVAQL